MPRCRLLALCTVAAALGPAAVADASLFSRNIEEAPANLISLTFSDAAGEPNDVRFSHEGTEVVARESSAQLRQENCAGGAVEARCDATGVESFLIDTRDGDDTVDIDGLGTLPFPTDVQLGPGADRVTIGSATRAKADGDAGNDVLTGGPGADNLTGGEGDDRILGGDGADELATGGGSDTVEGGAGDDRIYGSGQGIDHISCGPGEDRVFAEPRDVIAADCEVGRTVLIPPAKRFSAKVRADGTVLIPLGTLPERARMVVRLGTDPPQGQGTRVPLGSGTRNGAAGSQQVRVRLSRQGRRELRSRARIRVTAVVRVTTQAGKTSTTDVTGHLVLSARIRKQLQRESRGGRAR